MITTQAESAARCHEIQVGLSGKDVPDFEFLPLVGMAVCLALHLRGLPAVDYNVLRIVASTRLQIPTVVIKRLAYLLAEVEFLRVNSQGETIKSVIPTVPYYQDLYHQLGEYAEDKGGFNEAENLSIEIISRLAKSPQNSDSLFNKLGADKSLFDRTVKIGLEGSYINLERSRGKNILISPAYFSENATVYSDSVAASGSKSVESLIQILKQFQGTPLRIIEQKKEIGGIAISADQLNILKKLATNGAIKPPSIRTEHSGENHFMFTPTPYSAALSPLKRDIYEKGMAIVSAVRQGQYLPKKYAIRYPSAVIRTLREKHTFRSATTEFLEQYKNLVQMCVGKLVHIKGDYYQFQIIDTEENREALEIAQRLVDEGQNMETQVDESARLELQQNQEYIDSMVAAGNIKRREHIKLSQSQQMEIDNLFLGV